LAWSPNTALLWSPPDAFTTTVPATLRCVSAADLIILLPFARLPPLSLSNATNQLSLVPHV
ncbi:hypothetical protein J6590_102728, partial [Homalodisca vitripennis]